MIFKKSLLHCGVEIDDLFFCLFLLVVLVPCHLYYVHTDPQTCLPIDKPTLLPTEPSIHRHKAPNI